MALPRFLVSNLPEQGAVELDASESHHASRVLRMNPGDPCVIFDGQGYQASATIASVDKKSTKVEYSSRHFEPRDHNDQLHVAVAMPKGDRQRNVIEKLVELGVDRLTLIDTNRSVAKFDQSGLEKLERYTIEACKQSQRNRLMKIEPLTSWESWIADRKTMDFSCSETWVLHPHSNTPTNPPQARRSSIREFLQHSNRPSGTSKKSILFAVGPEGGFTEEEIVQAIQAGLGILDLGERILRVETAVSVAAVLGTVSLNSTPV